MFVLARATSSPAASTKVVSAVAISGSEVFNLSRAARKADDEFNATAVAFGAGGTVGVGPDVWLADAGGAFGDGGTVVVAAADGWVTAAVVFDGGGADGAVAPAAPDGAPAGDPGRIKSISASAKFLAGIYDGSLVPIR